MVWWPSSCGAGEPLRVGRPTDAHWGKNNTHTLRPTILEQDDLYFSRIVGVSTFTIVEVGRGLQNYLAKFSIMSSRKFSSLGVLPQCAFFYDFANPLSSFVSMGPGCQLLPYDTDHALS